MTRPTEGDIAKHFDDGVDCCAPRRDASKRPGFALVKLLRRQLADVGLAGRSVLELGCGRGELSLDLIHDGAASVTGIDLSPDAIEYARRTAAEDGLSERADFRAGNAATTSLPSRDVVVHHRVICCYHDVDAFLAASIGAAGSIYAFSMPRSRGIWGIGVRVALKLENLTHSIKRRGFRAFVHDERVVHSALSRAGFHLKSRSDRGGWFAAVYVS
ncbi:MAG: class I SAM-dependent methyltransferase [Actinomycetota bacterium]|nr:methyltransferase domain-containing protein [Actinomycetota bacterium]